MNISSRKGHEFVIINRPVQQKEMDDLQLLIFQGSDMQLKTESKDFQLWRAICRSL